MAAGFRDFSVIHDDDKIGVPDGGKKRKAIRSTDSPMTEFSRYVILKRERKGEREKAKKSPETVPDVLQ